MILQALKAYYDRMALDPESAIAPEGWEWKEIPFIVVLGNNGDLLQIEDTREGEGKKKRGKLFLVPQSAKKTSGIAANLLWDTANYVFGIVNTEGMDNEQTSKALIRASEQKQAFVKRITEELPQTPNLKAIITFLTTVAKDRLESENAWQDIYASNSVVSFRFDEEKELFCQSKEVQEVLEQKLSVKEKKDICLVSGEKDKIAELHIPIKGVYGAQSSGANIVSFNLEPFRSFNKKQGENSPVGESSMFAYTTALNTLLNRQSSQHLLIGDASTVFWSEKRTHFESDFASFFKEPDKDNPEAGIQKIRNLFEAPLTGGYLDDDSDTKFYVLGLAPNAARIAVRFWEVGTISDFAEKIRQHFEDLNIVKPSSEPPYYSIWRILVNIAIQDKSENIPPNIAGDFMRSILDGTPYPATLFQAVLRRIHSDTENRVKPVRAALIKAYLNRYLRAHPNQKEKEVEMGLDTEQPSIGYQLGRLFAVLEKIQEEANPGLNATIRERYYGAASSSPVTVFGTLMRLKNHHLAKIDNKGRVVNLERLIGEIVGHIGDFPSHLDLHEQGKFALGYYHQRQDLFTKKENDNQ
ncbi:MAG TPA: type I-C CRISPR-associated protein Cas8c/Csd1 [Rectinema sp.]|nr:type I-C CRISPR-associated protein Cas8c/Csd1 [Rectinema sp.]HOR91961.1 type I-C CRISPR-associated protein Cas8c/Csd1 [Rectinema sp.]HPD69904.1 type I-C CRISPR-associated protein Cas8c/Csd1 [Rectinema sp.]HPK79914.1 type I-C CRISPR-associated protein Cas8c/Csd1 [Rectinema sp.]HQH88463.1 type I-C CRISPR-associated protein Cas8c/Csd1 [Rectinema sp.]